MPQRLHERFPKGTAVEIFFPSAEQWLAGIVVRHEPPGIWVRTPANGRVWFVTNGRRIRPAHTSDTSHNLPHD